MDAPAHAVITATMTLRRQAGHGKPGAATCRFVHAIVLTLLLCGVDVKASWPLRHIDKYSYAAVGKGTSSGSTPLPHPNYSTGCCTSTAVC